MSTLFSWNRSDPPLTLPSNPRRPCLKWAVFQLPFWTELDYATKKNADLAPGAVSELGSRAG